MKNYRLQTQRTRVQEKVSAVDVEHVVELPAREALSLLTMPSLTDPTGAGATGTSGTTTTTPAATPTTDPTASPAGATPVPTNVASLPIVSKFDPSRLGIIG